MSGLPQLRELNMKMIVINVRIYARKIQRGIRRPNEVASTYPQSREGRTRQPATLLFPSMIAKPILAPRYRQVVDSLHPGRTKTRDLDGRTKANLVTEPCIVYRAKQNTHIKVGPSRSKSNAT